MLNFETYYHIYNHANGDDNLFREEKNYAYFLEKYRQHIDPIADTIAWCLMPNHFHLLLRIKSEEEIASTSTNFSKVRNFGKVVEDEAAKSNYISKQFANFFSSYTQAFNKVYGRRGWLFLKNFKRKAIASDEYLRNLIVYIHLNPVKHGFTREVTDWKWTSYDNFSIDTPELLTVFFEDKVNYQSIHLRKCSFFGEYEQLENELT